MLTPISDSTLRVVTQAALGLFEKQAHELCINVRLGLITRSEAVEILEVKATYNQIIWYCGPQRAEQIMAEHLNTKVTA
jgi:hypothetical protein